MKRIIKQYDFAIQVLRNNASIVMAVGPNEAWRDDCLAAVRQLRAARRKVKESRPTVQAKRPAQQCKGRKNAGYYGDEHWGGVSAPIAPCQGCQGIGFLTSGSGERIECECAT